MIRYAVTMGIRMVCIVLMFFVQGWWLVVCAVGAIVLPYFAVVAANVHGDQRSTVLRPGPLSVLPPQTGSLGTEPDAERSTDSSTDSGTDSRGDSR